MSMPKSLKTQKSYSKRKKALRRGNISEFCACLWLRLKGYKILNRRFKCKVGEIDCIASKRNTLIFVEVKHRKTVKDGLEAINHKQQLRIGRAAQYYLKRQKADDLKIRFDAIVILPWRLPHHIKDAWRPVM